MRRVVGLVVLGAIGASAKAAPSETPVETRPVDGGQPSFRLEGRPAIDDIFGDTADYRRTVDRFLELTTQMQSMRDDFARSVQSTLAELQKSAAQHRRSCPSEAVASPYARAHHLGAEYLRVGRELTRHFEQVRELDRLGESIGLTPDYRWKVRKVLQQYQTLLTDYREMKVAFHDQLNDELRYVGCDLGMLIQRGDPTGKIAAPLEWPQPGQPGAPGVQPRNHEKAESMPPSLPPEKVPPPQPIAIPKRTLPADGRDAQPRWGVLFYVDNTRCQRGTQVQLDGKKLGDVPAGARVGFQTVPGPHDLCLLDDSKKTCGQPGTLRRSYLHEGWTISLRCE